MPALSLPAAPPAGATAASRSLPFLPATLGALILLATTLTPAQAASFDIRPTPGDGDFPTGVTIADWDGDGDIDAAANFYVSGTLQLFLNDGDGTFSAGTVLAADPIFGPWWVDAGDIDADGDADLVAAHLGSDALLLYENLGGGSFSGPTTLPVVERPEYVILADLDADGDLDLAAPNEVAEVSIFLNDGDGDFVAGPVLPVPFEEGHTIRTGDFDRDGHVDLAISFSTQPIAGPCEDRRPPSVIAFGDGTGAFPRQELVGEEMGYHGAVGDWNGDGWDDLATADLCSSTHEVRVALNRGDGTGLLDLVTVMPVGTAHDDLQAFDLDCDDDLDLLVGDDDEDVGVILLLGDGTGGFVEDPDGPFPVGGAASAIRVGFLDRDARPDVMVSTIDTDGVASLLNRTVTECSSTCRPRTQGYWKHQCSAAGLGARGGGRLHEDDLEGLVLALRTTASFGAPSLEEACAILHDDDRSDACVRASTQFLALLLNVASGRLDETCCLATDAGGVETLAERIERIDALIASGEESACKEANDLADAVNTGDDIVPCDPSASFGRLDPPDSLETPSLDAPGERRLRPDRGGARR